jgi:hypothetical protein
MASKITLALDSLKRAERHIKDLLKDLQKQQNSKYDERHQETAGRGRKVSVAEGIDLMTRRSTPHEDTERTAQAKIERLRAALKNYGEHTHACACFVDPMIGCDCGFNDELRDEEG